MLSANGYFTTIRSTAIKGGNNRYEKPLHPEVLSYIKNNWDKLDTGFKALAERKGINEITTRAASLPLCIYVSLSFTFLIRASIV